MPAGTTRSELGVQRGERNETDRFPDSLFSDKYTCAHYGIHASCPRKLRHDRNRIGAEPGFHSRPWRLLALHGEASKLVPAGASTIPALSSGVKIQNCQVQRRAQKRASSKKEKHHETDRFHHVHRTL